MTSKDFALLIESRHNDNLTILREKAHVYAHRDDRLSNFKDAAAMNSETPAEALWGMVSKHIIATKDMIKSKQIPDDEWIDAYLTDIINYMYLLEAIWTEQREKKEQLEDSS